jgi:hypothetical protein
MRASLVIGLVVWVGVCVLVGGLLLVQHLVALPTPPTSDASLAQAVAGVGSNHAGWWRVAHVMYRSCTCSQRTIAHLLTTRRPDRTDEIVVMVDDDGANAPEDVGLRAAGFQVEVITPDVLHARFHVEAAPLLVVARPDHELAYVGGYNRHKQSAAYEDLSILAELRAGSEPSPLPVFGCATSAQLANTLDPLGLRRW